MAIRSDDQIQIVSDLHLENPSAYEIFEIVPKSWHLALIGDIGHAVDEDRVLLARKSRAVPQFLALARSKLHDFQMLIDEERQSVRLGRFVFLERTRYDLTPDLTILGCTLYSRIQPEQHDYVSFGLNDYYHIKDWTVEDHDIAHTADLAWLNEQVSEIAANEPNRRVSIFTHHSPTIDSRAMDPNHANSKISSGFMTDLSSECCWTSPNVKLWAFGHTHFNCDFVGDKTGKSVVANQRGYYFSAAQRFDAENVISL
ncbi:hypothetical protein BDV97DRAFT_370135 [Delphinella strobiligena]|nr:hypothetical protein BDV97DRAFT_370135 [Delphinella strobiligena]